MCIRDREEILPKLKEYRVGDVVSKVTCKEKYVLKGTGKKVALLDLGAKKNIAKSLNDRGCEVTVYPAHTSAEEIIASNPDGIMLSNGPGDPADCTSVILSLIHIFHPKKVAVWEEEKARELRTKVKDLDVCVLSGMEGLLELAVMEEADVLVTAVVGMIGIRPTIEAIKAGKDIALANKETLVTAGHLIMPLAAEKQVKICLLYTSMQSS